MIDSRRDFLKFSTASLVALSCYLSSHKVYAEILPRTSLFPGPLAEGHDYVAFCEGPAKQEQAPNVYVPATMLGSVMAVDAANGDSLSIPVPFNGHVAIPNRARPYELVAFEKWGKRGAMVDIKERKVLAQVEIQDENLFFGHATFNTDGSLMATSEDAHKTPHGQMSIRDASTLKVVRTIKSYGMKPHECRSPDHGKTIMVINEGYSKPGVADSMGNISWIDFETGELVKQITLDSWLKVRYTHCNISYDNWLCAVGAGVAHRHFNDYDTKNGPHADHSDLITFISPEGKILKPDLPADLRQKITGEALSIAFLDNTPLVAVTMPQSKLLLIMDYKKQALLDAVPMDTPKGILPVLSDHGTDFIWLVSGSSGRLVSVAGDAGQAVTQRLVAQKGRDVGSHLTHISI